MNFRAMVLLILQRVAAVAAVVVVAQVGCGDAGPNSPGVEDMTGEAAEAWQGLAPDSIHGIAGKCLDVDHASSANGTRVQLWSCNATAAQRWAIESAQLVTMGKCFDVNNWSTADNTKLQVWDCNSGANQAWTFSGGQLRGYGGKCATATGTYAGAPVVLRTCTGADNAHWTYVDGQLIGPGGLCLDIYGGQNVNGTPAQLWSCLGVPQQTFAFQNARLHAATGGCLDVVGGVAANGAGVQQWSCTGAPQQLWTITGPRITGLGGKCVDVSNAGTTEGTRVQLWDCQAPPVVQQRWYRGDVAYAPRSPLDNPPSTIYGYCKFGGYCARDTTATTAAHAGVDMMTSANTPVYAICDGTVVRASPATTAVNDRVTVVKSKNCGGYATLYVYYGHIAPLANVTAGQPVWRGTAIGAVGDLGSNSHLHLGLRTYDDPNTSWGYNDVGVSTAQTCGSATDPNGPDNVRAQKLATREWLDAFSFGQAYAWWGGTDSIAACAQ